MVQSPFPGMDPYLEAPGLWPDAHESLMYIFREQLTPLLAPKYVTELSTQIVIDEVTGDNGGGNGSGVVQSRSVLPDVTVTRSASPGTPTQEESFAQMGDQGGWRGPSTRVAHRARRMARPAWGGW